MGATNEADAAIGVNPPPKETAEAPPTARMFYVAYFKKDAPPESRPITFVYNGGPGSSTVWLHMGAFGPARGHGRRPAHQPAPYQLVDNAYSLLDSSDLVFIDAPGTGFGRIFGKDKEKAFLRVDPDAHAFVRFIARFLSNYQRWNSPKYLFGESYGTTRSAVVAGILETESHIDLNGVILLSQILNFDDSVDAPQWNPGIDLPYQLALPTYAATAWYHHKRLPNAARGSRALPGRGGAIRSYATMLSPGPGHRSCPRLRAAGHRRKTAPVHRPARRPTFSRPTCGSPAANSTIPCKTAMTLPPAGWTAVSPALPSTRWLEEAAYDPQSSAIASAYVSAFNDYGRRQLKFGEGLTYLPEEDSVNEAWEGKHKAPGAPGDSWG